MEGALTVKKKVLMIAAALLAAAVLFCLWYTRPRNWTELAGIDEVDAISGSLKEFRLSENGETTPLLDHWKLDEIEGGAEASDLIRNALKESSYRADLGNLRNDTPFPRTILYGKGSDVIHLVLHHQTDTVTLDVDSGGQMSIYTSNGIAAYQADDALYGALANIVHMYGALQEN